MCVTLEYMVKVDRLSLAPSGEIGAMIRTAAAEAGDSVSAWLTEAARMRLRNQVLGQTLAEWFGEDGYPSEEQISAAEALFDSAERDRLLITS